jgi:hypothetical protein
VSPDGTVCRPISGLCDEQEVCSGGTCPPDVFSSSSTVCRAAIDTTCDAEERCTGSSSACPGDLVRDGVLCRAANGECDNAEFCFGGRCPTDVFKSNSNTCGGSPRECENQARCTGSSPNCPAHSPKGTNTPCGPQPPSDPTCALRQNCDGSGGGCPSGFRFKSNGAVCKAANGDCDVDDTCDGSTQNCAERFRPTTYVCNSKNDDCGDQQTCTGSSTSCPPRPVRSTSYICRPLTGTGCDIADRCDGITYNCPDTKQPRGFVCRANTTDCDVAEVCDGFSVNCPSDGNRPRNFVCRASKGLCDPEEICDGSSTPCPADVLHPRGHECRMKEGPCDVADSCSGGDAQCPPDAKVAIDTPCNPSKSICDVPELCNGISDRCPPDEVRPASANFVCRDSSGACDLRETCDGSSAECPTDKFSVNVTCRSVALGNSCDVAEVCGNSANCPPDGFKPLNTSCDDASDLTTNDVCDNAGVCSGKCLVDMACNDRNKCTEDTCSMETGRCIFTPIADCVPEIPPTNCSVDSSFRFDLLKSADICFFEMKLTPLNGTAIARIAGVSFGVVPTGDDGSGARDAKIRPNTGILFEFPSPWTAAVESVILSSVQSGTLVAVVYGDPMSQSANIADAASKFVASNGTQTVANGVWIVSKGGVQRAPPAFSSAPTSSWAIVHVSGAPFSLDGAQISRPIGAGNVTWIAVVGGTTVAMETVTDTIAAVDMSSPVDAALIGGIVGGVVGGLLLLCGAFAAGVWWTRKSAAKRNDLNPSTEMRSPTPQNQAPEQQTASFSNQDYRSVSGILMGSNEISPQSTAYVEMAMNPNKSNYNQVEFHSARGPGANGYDELELRPNTAYADASAFEQQQH